MVVEEKLDYILRLYLECEIKEVLGPSYDLKLLKKEENGKADERYLLTEDLLPHYQLIVRFLLTSGPQAEKHLRLRCICFRIHGILRDQPLLSVGPHSRDSRLHKDVPKVANREQTQIDDQLHHQQLERNADRCIKPSD